MCDNTCLMWLLTRTTDTGTADDQVVPSTSVCPVSKMRKNMPENPTRIAGTKVYWVTINIYSASCSSVVCFQILGQ